MFGFLHFIIVTFIITSVVAIRLSAQSFQLLVPESHYAEVRHETTSEELKYHHRIKYVGPNDAWVLSKVDVLSITPGHSYQYCDLGTCYPPQTSSFKSNSSFPMSPNQETDDDNFNYISLHPNNIDGKTSLKFTFFIEDNPLDFVEYQVDFIIGATSTDNDVPINSNNVIKSYPNPASNFTIFKINNRNEFIDASIELFNNLGTLLEIIKFESNDNLILLNCSKLPSGLYYYRLLDNGLSRGIGTLLITR